MIYLGFILDYIINIFLPVKSYFIINDIEKNNLFSIIIGGLLLDILYQKLFFNLLILLIIYFIFKLFNIKKKYYVIKNIFLFIIYFNITYFFFGFNLNYYLEEFILSLFMQIFYIYFSRWLLK